MKIHYLLVLLLAVLATGCWTDLGDDDDDDDDDDGGADLNCNPVDCLNIASQDDCADFADDETVARACELCLGTLEQKQIAQCMLDYRHDAEGEELEQACTEQVVKECHL